MIVLSCKDIHKSYGIDVILDKITLSINEGEKIGFIGANGAGKSTLFKILTSQLDYDNGELFIDKNKKVGYLSQNLELTLSNTIYEETLLVFHDLLGLEKRLNNLESKMNEPYDTSKEEYNNRIIKEYTLICELYNNRGGYTYKAEINKVLKGLGFMEEDYNKPINILSGGQKTRVALCKLLLKNPDILLLDEPTNHLDLDAIEWLEDYLKSYKGTIFIISHDRFFLDAITNKTFELTNGHVDSYNGNYTNFIDLKKKNYEVQLKAYNLQRSEIKRQEDIITRYRSFNREKSVRAAESRQKSLDKLDRVDSPDTAPRETKIKFETEIKSGNDVLHAENLSKRFGDNLLFENLNLDIKRSEKFALIGENGRGKTTLLNIIMDKISSDTGIKILGKNIFVGYYDQEQSNLNPEKTIIDEVWDEFPKLTTTEVRTALAAFLFIGEDVFKSISTLSGGERCRINLLKIMLSKSNFLLLDEPTNHLDIMSREALEDSILGYDGTVLVISHDRYFLNKVITKILELKQDGLKEYLGNYTYYIEKKKNPLRFQVEEAYDGMSKTQINLDKRKKRDEQKLEKQKKIDLKDLEDKITSSEQRLEKLNSDLCLEEIYSSPSRSVETNNQISSIKTELETLYANWEDFISEVD
ncbi:ABC-F family ATP-binding cassette domain-containing protein [Clostridium sp. CM028]|uniref:ribosomal protection-like ABC-F family protein n=1 Tax=unclassified Clostridium TaxID=2614128 RepID=UPI001C0C0CEF|nr:MULTISPECIES: ABC-F family ATP-binding cassette domain-containing protein [unclassified Clostridium]MBU3091287.1 ABC-F family ATP-binding cassette domain-containing protein [Clostridium sp. CF011]MBW9146834.1 ABC-F family ATP-binding cassette domain-containing protein [Clostridium sp. CM027]MBW9150145.1 ABC-F family ATP-binding cassette domain-containing protein [Clostridium sp. CM028]UVE39687.1 ABC-F family ATP-binding cassette domain-containing protein [Clostridium sp. CM027]WAG68594.1 AB